MAPEKAYGRQIAFRVVVITIASFSAGCALVFTGGSSVQIKNKASSLLSLPAFSEIRRIQKTPFKTTSLEYFKDLGYKNAEKCDGSIPTAQQSPVAIETGGVGIVGNVVKERLPPWGWVQKEGLNGLYRMKTPGTDSHGLPNVQAFVSGNKFDMKEASVYASYGGTNYVLDHFALKTPSEHTINGETFDMEQQFVHYPVKGEGEEGAYKALIVSVLYKKNPLNSPEYIHQLYHAIPCMGEGKHCQRAISFATMARTVLYQTPSKFGRLTYAYDPSDVCNKPPCVYGGSAGDSMISLWVPPDARANFRSFFRYTGSRTTPPCSEDVQWLVLNNPVPMQEDHLAAFQLAFGDIARPTQPLNGRVIEESTSFFW
jgi:carbonic anhydrase